MRRFFSTLSLLLCIVCFAWVTNAQSKGELEKAKSEAASRITTKYDKSKGVTTVRLREMAVTRLTQEKQIANNLPLHEMHLEVFFTYPGEQLNKPAPEAAFRFRTAAATYTFLRPQQVIAAMNAESTADGKAIVLGMTDYTSTSPKFNSIYEEFLVIKVPTEALAKMIAAKSLELYVGPVSYRFTPEQMGYLATIYERMVPKASP